MKKTILGLSLLALGLAGTAYAGDAAAGDDPMGDKTVTRAEFLAQHGQMFDKMDANRDGKLDAADRTAHMGQMFDEIDADHNGSISREEFAAAHQRGPEGGERREHAGMPGGRQPGGMGMMMVKMADGNKDGSVTRDEFMGMAGQHFDKMDANHDGKLTKEERKSARAKMKGMHRGAKPGGADGHAGHMPPPPPPAN
jgi:hypothetical protein